jgi:hypothetical protein
MTEDEWKAVDARVKAWNKWRLDKANQQQAAACICERGHDRPYWTCPVHGDVTVTEG